MKQKGTVYLIGAGPGDVGLLTVRGAELLARADVVVYDGLVNAELLRLAPASAEVIYGGKHSERQAVPQTELNRLLISKAEAGKTVVRLKGGDPYIFGRGGEEAEELAAASVPFEVVPGVSSMAAVPNYAGIPLTHRGHCSSFTVLTGHEDPNKEGSSIDWAQVATAPGTKVVLMGLKRIREIAATLVAKGMASGTPVAMIRWGTTGRQQSIEGTLATIADVAEETQFGAPTVTVIGDVVRLRSKLNWFEKRPLFGQRVVVTRAREQAGLLSRPLLDLGADVLEVPTIKIAPPANKEDLKDAILGLHEYDWIVFTSANGVTTFFDYFFKAFDDLRDIGGVRIAAVGPGTAAKLQELHLKVDLMPEEALATRIASAFESYQSIENLRILLMRAEVANPELPRALEKLGAIVDDVASYQTVAETEDINGAAARLVADGAEWIIFTSASTVEHFHERFNLPDLLRKFPKARLASIGPETSKAIAKLGLKAAVEANPHTADGLIRAVCRATRN
ncbi:MAG: uroporphyrinogen-III C-methyltransferase [Verrucomicrobiota bacterium]